MSNTEQSVVAQWNEILLDAIRSGVAKPTETAYQLHLTSSAAYDAWAAYDADAFGAYVEQERPAAEHTEANKLIAISYANLRMLEAFFPDQADKFHAFMLELGLDPTDQSTDPATAAGVGNLAAAGVFEARAEDGTNYAGGYADTTGYAPVNGAEPGAPNAPGGAEFDPNAWQPLRVPTGTVLDENGNPVATDDPGSYVDQTGLTPHWGGVTTFALQDTDEVRPPDPPKLDDFSPYVDTSGNVTTNDAAYRAQVAEVLEVSGSLTAQHKVVAEFWADGPRTESPPGHWNQIAQDISKREGYGIDDDVKLFMALNAAIFDVSVATWDVKYETDYVRPQSAIRHLYHDQEVEAWAGPDQGIQTILGQEWQPYQNTTFVTPPFPGYTSGHSGFSRAAADTIAAYVGSDAFYDGVSQGNYDLDDIPGTDLLGQYVAAELSFEHYIGPPVVLQWDTLRDAADEAGISRIYGGIHIKADDQYGRILGSEVAEIAQERWQALFTRGGDDIIFADDDGGLTIAGAGNDVVIGSEADDIIEGGSGDDVLLGNDGDDIMLGQSGADIMRGGRGDDISAGGDGADTHWGRLGDDTFVIVAGDTGVDTVEDFGRGEDVLALVGFGPVTPDVVEDGRDAVVRVDGAEVARLENTDLADLEVGANLVVVDEFAFV